MGSWILLRRVPEKQLPCHTSPKLSRSQTQNAKSEDTCTFESVQAGVSRSTLVRAANITSSFTVESSFHMDLLLSQALTPLQSLSLSRALLCPPAAPLWGQAQPELTKLSRCYHSHPGQLEPNWAPTAGGQDLRHKMHLQTPRLQSAEGWEHRSNNMNIQGKRQRREGNSGAELQDGCARASCCARCWFLPGAQCWEASPAHCGCQ